MHITEIPNKIHLDMPHFVCDNSLGDHIQHPLPRCCHFMSFIGVAGSGKSSVAFSLLQTKKPRQYRNVFDHIYLFIPKNSYASIGKGNPFKDHDKEKIYHTFDIESLGEVSELIKENSENGEYSLILIDDFADSLKNQDIAKIFINIINNRRHYKTSVWVLSQYLNAIPLPIRRTITHLLFFKFNNKKEYASLFDELIHLKKDTADSIMKYCFQKRHDHCFIDLNHNKLYRNFQELVFSESD